LDTSSVGKVTSREDLTGIWPKKESVKDCFGVTNDEDQSIAIYVRFLTPADYSRFYNDLYERIPALKQDARDLNNWSCAITDLTKEMRMPRQFTCLVFINIYCHLYFYNYFSKFISN
jgi:hypothetical protein